jgi:hypothetical protein
MAKIYTLDARDNIFLSVMRDHLGLNEKEMRTNIIGAHREVVNILRNKHVEYEEIKSALIPRTDRMEIAFLFDSGSIENAWYGLDVIQKILPQFNRDSIHSVLGGDLLGDDQSLMKSLVDKYTVFSKPFMFRHSSLIYCIYITGLTEKMLYTFNKGLKEYNSYIGYVPATYWSEIKTIFAFYLVNLFIKFKNIIIQKHEDDRSNSENINFLGYPFPDYGYKIISLQVLYFDMFLSYKIEREVFDIDRDDISISLNSISSILFPLGGLKIEIEDNKFKYILDKKLGILKNAQIENISKEEFSELIRLKISSSYIYNLEYIEQYDVAKFNIVIELPRQDGGFPERMVVSFEYKPIEKKLRLITIH